MEPHEFLGKKVDYESSKAVIVPVHFASTTYTQNTAEAPRTILLSWNFEEYDVELGYNPSNIGIYPMVEVWEPSIEETMKRLNAVASKTIKDKKFPVFLGGDHSITIGITSAFDNITVICFDAHADLKEEYAGGKYSHGCVIKRVREKFPVIQFGVRSMDECEAKAAAKLKLFRNFDERIMDEINTDVYVSIDVDVLDPTVMPAVVLPEPNGMSWNELSSALKLIFERKNVVGCDICELSPIPGFATPNVLCANLAYKMIGYKFMK